jgi:hypothetical protein
MIDVLVLVGAVLGYFLLGALYARCHVARIYKRAVEKNTHWSVKEYREYWIRQEMQGALVPRALFWPIAMVVDLCAGPGARWFMRPVTERQEHAAKLRADAETWDEAAKHPSATADEKIMAEELAKLLREQAKGVEL